MIFNILGAVTVIIGAVIGYFTTHTTQGALVGLGSGAIVLAIAIFIVNIPLDVLVFGAMGAFLGAVAAKAVGWFLFQLDNEVLYGLFNRYSMLINVLFAYLGGMVAVKKRGELELLDKNVVMPPKHKDIKVIDTSVLIDGRLADIAQTGFLSGNIIVPRFVLQELQTVADSSDNTKRQRGRRGLDILKKLQEQEGINVRIYDRDIPHLKEVDAKLIELAKELAGKIATTDYNLNKVAAVQGVSVLNVNDLAAALKSVVLPGDSFGIFLAKDGKERAQAVGYLDDGTMVVVEEGRPHIGKRVTVNVNSILQTSAGRMIFAKFISVLENNQPDPR